MRVDLLLRRARPLLDLSAGLYVIIDERSAAAREDWTLGGRGGFLLPRFPEDADETAANVLLLACAHDRDSGAARVLVPLRDDEVVWPAIKRAAIELAFPVCAGGVFAKPHLKRPLVGNETVSGQVMPEGSVGGPHPMLRVVLRSALMREGRRLDEVWVSARGVQGCTFRTDAASVEVPGYLERFMPASWQCLDLNPPVPGLR